MQPHWMQKIVLTTFIKEPPSLHVPMEEVLVTPNTTRSKAAERGSSTAPQDSCSITILFQTVEESAGVIGKYTQSSLFPIQLV